MDNPMLSIKIFDENLLSIVNSSHFDVGLKLIENLIAK